MSAKDGDERFLARWSRRKSGATGGEARPETKRGESATPAEPVPAPAVAGAAPATSLAPTTSSAPATSLSPAAAVEAPPEPRPTLADVARLGRDSDYAPFVRPGVDPVVKNAALKKLFSDPRFNVMDGLDTYIDDYGKPDPIPPGMLRRLNQARDLGLFDAPPEEHPSAAVEDNAALSAAATRPASVAQSAAPPAPGNGASATTLASPATPAISDDDPDLRLQQDDGAGRDSAAPSARA